MGLFTERDEETTNEIIIGKLNRIEAKLDAVIKAMHDYDGDEWDEPNDALKEAAAQYNEKVLNERMDIIEQNGNTGEHYEALLSKMTQDNQDMGLYDVDAFDDYGKRVDKDKDKMNPDDKRTVGNNKYYRKPNTPVTPKKMEDGVVKHQRYRQPHKH